VFDEVGFGNENFDRGPDVDYATRLGTFSISVDPATRLVKLNPNVPVAVNHKVAVAEGSFAGRELYRNALDEMLLVPPDTASLDVLYYQDGINPNINGVIELVEQQNSVVNVDTIQNSSTYTSPNGITFTNGLKVKFVGDTTPNSYEGGEYYVEGVGEKIQLLPVEDFIANETWLELTADPLDETLYDARAYDADTNAPIQKDYFVLKRSSKERSAWARHNRWFHQDVINLAALHNETEPVTEAQRARRPIIEFDANLQLFDFGKQALKPVTYVDTQTTDAFSFVEGQTVKFNSDGKISDYSADGIPLVPNTRIIFAADNDPAVQNNVYTVSWITPQSAVDDRTWSFTGDGIEDLYDLNFEVTDSLRLTVLVDGIDASTSGHLWSLIGTQYVGFVAPPPDGANVSIFYHFEKQIHLEIADVVKEGDTVLVLEGLTSQGLQYYFTNGKWTKGQQKTKVNQPPLFDLTDASNNSFADKAVYPGSNFAGSKVFGYKPGSGTNDLELGFPLSYRNINNIGDIVYTDFLASGSFSYKHNDTLATVQTSTGSVPRNNFDGTTDYLNQWVQNSYKTRQYQTQTFFATAQMRNLFPLSGLPASVSGTRAPPALQVMVNNKSLTVDEFAVDNEHVQAYLQLDTDLKIGDKVDVRLYSETPTATSVFEIPSNLENNALNTSIAEFTSGQINGHIQTVLQNTPALRGSFVGSNNSRDLGNIKPYGGKIVQNAGAPHLANLFLNDSQASFIDSVLYNAREYTRFKNKFLELLNNLQLSDPSDPVKSVDEVFANITYNKSPEFPFFSTDMLPFGNDYNELSYTVIDVFLRQYNLSSIFTLENPSNKAVLLYLNDTLLCHGRDYTFLSDVPVVVLSDALTTNVGDKLIIKEYNSTDGGHIPATPTKLGFYPSFFPAIVTDGYDDAERQVLRGHDGSYTALFGDSRDDSLLEFEMRVYNNIKVNYEAQVFDVRDYIPGAFRSTSYSLNEFTEVLSNHFNTWLGSNGLSIGDYQQFDPNDRFSWNYSQTTDKVFGNALPVSSWRGMFKYFYDTDAPHRRPWEMLGFSERPSWWVQAYGPMPYTGGNAVMWDDLEAGRIIAGPRKGIDSRYVRPGLSKIIPVDNAGNLLSPLDALIASFTLPGSALPYKFGDQGPVETAWRQSSDYPFSLQIALALTVPAEYFGLNVDKNKQIIKSFEANNSQWIYSDTRLRSQVPAIAGDVDANGNRIRVNSYINWIGDYVTSLGLNINQSITTKVNRLDIRLSYKVAGYTDKKMLRVYADQASPSSTNTSIIIPDSDYQVKLVKSFPKLSVTYSGVIVTKTNAGWSVLGYDDSKPYFNTIPSKQNANKTTIIVGNIAVVKFREGTDQTVPVPYGTEFFTVEEVSEFLICYGRYLTQAGFVFDSKLDSDAGWYQDWDLSVREFLFYVQQNWGEDVAISLSPVGSNIKFNATRGTVDGLGNSARGTRVMTEDFKVLRPEDYSVNRIGSEFTLTVNPDAGVGIYLLDVDVVEHEHVLVFNNLTQFNDVIYQPEIGVRQYRLKLSGFKTDNWDGTFGAAGFIINDDNIETWMQGKNYYKGDIVKFKNAYFTASANVPGSPTFDFATWLKIDYNKINKGLLPNLASKAKQYNHFYDINQSFESDADRLGKGLIGFFNRPYLDNLQISDTSQAKFYQGLITQKGTQRSFDKLLRAKLDNFDSSTNVFEEWALRIGTYGATGIKKTLEVPIRDPKKDPQVLELLENNDEYPSEWFGYKQNDLLVKARPYTKNFLSYRDGSSSPDDLLNAGYLKLDDVNFTAPSFSQLSSVDASKAKEGDYLWVAVNNVQQWDVYRTTHINAFIKNFSITGAAGMATVTCYANHGLSENNVVLLNIGNGGQKITGFYVISNVKPTSFTIQTRFASVSQTQVEGVVYLMKSMRFPSVDSVPASEPLGSWVAGDKLFIDSVDNAGWNIYEKQEAWANSTVYSNTNFSGNDLFGTSVAVDPNNFYMLAGQPGSQKVITYRIQSGSLQQDVTLGSPYDDTVDFGTVLATSGDGTTAIGAPTSGNVGYVFLTSRDEITGSFAFRQALAPQTLDAAGGFGSDIAISKDGAWLYVSQPNAGTGKLWVYQRVDVTVPEPAVNTFTGDGVTTVFTLTGTAADPSGYDAVSVLIDGEPALSYVLAGSTITFSSAPAVLAEITVIVKLPYPEQVLEGDGVTTTVTLTGTSASPTSIYALQVSSSGELLIPFKDYTLSGSTVTFTVAPANGIVVGIRQVSYYTFIAALAPSDAASGDKFSSSVRCNDDGTEIVIGARNAAVSATHGGKTYVYHRAVDAVVADGTSTIFSATTHLFGITQVYVNKSEVGNFSVVAIDGSHDGVVFTTPPPAGAVVEIVTNIPSLVATLSGADANELQASANFGNAVALNNTSIFVGAPNRNGTVADVGSVYWYINQGMFYSEITGTVANPTMSADGAIKINNFTVFFANGSALASIVSTINARGIPGVTANATSEHKLHISYAGEGLSILPVLGNAIADLGLNIYKYVQTLVNSTVEEYSEFGNNLAALEDTIVVGASKASTELNVTFDDTTTFFDNTATKFNTPVAHSGAVCTYEYIQGANGEIGRFIPAQRLSSTTLRTADQFGASLAANATSIYVGTPGDDSLANNAGLVYSFVRNNDERAWTLVREQTSKVDINLINKVFLYDSVTELKIADLDFLDPYKGKILGKAAQEICYFTAYDPATYNNGLTLVQNIVWGKEQVGKVWWDLSRVRALDTEQSNLGFRASNWGTYFPGSQIVCWEWVESKVPPQQYILENKGVTVGSSFCQRATVDDITGIISPLYYFWAGNLTTIPKNAGRSLSVVDVQNLISNPRNSGIPYAAFVSQNAIALYNCVNLLSTNAVLSVDFSLVAGAQNVHAEYQLLAEHDDSSIPHDSIIEKMVDSLAGTDALSHMVPDPALTVSERTGTGIRPRQSLFENRTQALRCAVSYINFALAHVLVTDSKDLSGLFGEALPDSSQYDDQVASLTELEYLGTHLLSEGHRVLVVSDSSARNYWTIYTLRTSKWVLTKVQSYDVSRYWKYVDWTAADESNFLWSDTVQFIYQLYGLDFVEGQIIKVKDSGDGKSSLYKQLEDATWKLIHKEGGTIQVLDSVWDQSSNAQGFGLEGFDLQLFDEWPTVEIRSIISSVYNDIFTGDQQIEKNNFFFKMVNYLFTEQRYVDWIFKTSFLKVEQDLKGFKQVPVYQQDKQQLLLEYINEVKPYHSKVREYITSYNGVDTVQSTSTDFDVPAMFDIARGVYRSPTGLQVDDSIMLEMGAYTDWLANYKLELGDIEVIYGGSDYLTPPEVTVTGGGGQNARAIAHIVNGSIVRFTILDAGEGYISTPTILLSPGGGNAAVVAPRMVNQKVRSLKTTIKFDRITYAPFVKDWEPSTSFSLNDVLRYNHQAYIVEHNFTSGTTFSLDFLTLISASNFTSAIDRIWTYYQPKQGELGLDLEQLVAGLGYPGTMVTGAHFNQEPGFDVATYDLQAFDQYVIGAEGTAILDSSVLDANIVSSFLDTAIGTRPEDIIVSGGAFIDTYSSHAPEELLPGKVYDTLDLQVYTKARSPDPDGSNGFLLYATNYVAGTNQTFAYTQAGYGENELSVYTSEHGTLKQDTDYTVDFINKTVTVLIDLQPTERVLINSYILGGYNLVYARELIGDGTTVSFPLSVLSSFSDFGFVTINGVATDDWFFDTSNETAVITFDNAPADGAFITVHVYQDNGTGRQQFTQRYTQVITTTSSHVYNLDKVIGFEFPYADKIVVTYDKQYLRPPNQAYYTGDGTTTTYQLPDSVYIDPDTILTSDVLVAINGQEVSAGSGWTLAASDGVTVRSITFAVAPAEGSDIVLSCTSGAAYTINENNILVLDPALDIQTGHTVTVVSYTNHDPLKIRTQVFKGGETTTSTVVIGFDMDGYDESSVEAVETITSVVPVYTLSRPVSNKNYLQVTLDLDGDGSGFKLLSTDFNIEDGDKLVIPTTYPITDDSVIVTTHFTEDSQKPAVAFRIFKDLNDNVDYYKIPAVPTVLAEPLLLTDTEIVVEDASKLLVPDLVGVEYVDPEYVSGPYIANEPGADILGAVMINSERISYGTVQGNVLGQIRRGTLGTGATAFHAAGTSVVDVGAKQRIPNSNGKIWYNQGGSTASNGLGLQNSTTNQAKFLLNLRD
jgi:hypothetical protein